MDYEIRDAREAEWFTLFGSAAEVMRAAHEAATARFVPVMSRACETRWRALLAEIRPRRILEIGTAVGYSAAVAALLSDARIDTIERDAERLKEARDLWHRAGVEDKVRAYCGDADEILGDVLVQNRYDLVLIDAAKSRYLRYFLQCRPHVAAGGAVICDDMLYFGLVRGAGDPPRKHRTIVRALRAFLRELERGGYATELTEEGNGIAVIRII